MGEQRCSGQVSAGAVRCCRVAASFNGLGLDSLFISLPVVASVSLLLTTLGARLVTSRDVIGLRVRAG